MADDEENPFKLPPHDQIFLIREQERKKRAEERDLVKHQKVWEKTTASSRVHKNRRVDDGSDMESAELGASKQQAALRGARSSDGAGLTRDKPREKENVSEFVAKKREMFLVQMSLDVKKAEIVKLQEKTTQKDEALKKSEAMLADDVTRFDSFLQENDQQADEALKKSEAMLADDVTRFDSFLQENDQQAHKAMKKAEDMTKKKQEKMQRIKQLKSQVSAIQSEITKHTEQKIECVKFKEFLEKLTPPDWIHQQTELKRQRKQFKREAYVEKQMADINARIEAEFEAEEKAILEEREKETSKKRGRRRDGEEEQKEKQRALDMAKRKIKKNYKTRVDVEADYKEESSGEEMPLHFKEPKQLLDVFTSLEEQNLFLIQNSQETEKALEDVQQKFDELRKNSSSKTSKVKRDIDILDKQIAEENTKIAELQFKLSQESSGSKQQDLLKELSEKVEEVDSACGHEADHDPNVLQMLQAIETRLEEFLAVLDEAEESGQGGRVKELEKRKEQDRREQARKKRIEQGMRKQDDRLKNSLQRSQAPIRKKTGKQIMFRSPPLFQARRVVQEDDGFEEAQKDYQKFDIWINHEGVPNAAAPTRPMPA